MLGVGPMTYQGPPNKAKKPKAHARGATIPGPSTPGSLFSPSTPGSQSSEFSGFVNAQVHQLPPTPQLPSTPSLPTTGSFDSSNFHTAFSNTSTGLSNTSNSSKKSGFFRLFKKDSRSDGARSNEDLPSNENALYSRSEEAPIVMDSEPFDSLDEMGPLPPPDYIRPMPGHRLVPRREPNALGRITSIPLGDTQIGRARARAAARLTESISEVSESDWQTTTDTDEEQSAPVDSSSFYDETSQEFNVITDPEEQHESIAIASAPAGDKIAIAEWANYIKSYAEGSFNISKPPAPPTRSVNFTYLPAMYPHDEEMRIAKHHSIDAPWTPELGGKTIALMEAAAKRFHLSCASVSVFDERYDILRVEVGYNLMKLDRTTSIAAHALYSEEVLVILDTHQDWRFAGNPWVTGPPHIRFFAGAPLVSDSGEIIGVFSIFSKTPRSTFSRPDRRELAEFAALSVKDICLHGERMMDPDLCRSHVVSKRDTRANLIPNPLQFQKQPSPLITQPAFFPMGLQFQKEPFPLANQSEFLNEDAETSKSMSHESSIRDSDILYMAGPGHYRSISAESAFPNHNSPEAFRQYLTPTNSQNFPNSEGSDGRPYSTSDLTSVDMPQNNTPNDTFYSEDSYSQYQLDLDGPTTPKQPRFVFPNSIYRNFGPSASGISLNNSFGRLYMEGDSIAGSSYHQQLLGQDLATHRTTLSRPFSIMSSTSIGTTLSSRIGGPNNDEENPPSNAPRSNIAEAGFSCSFSGRQLGFDQAYAVWVDCPYPDMSDEELLGPNGLNLKILASYGLPYGYEDELNKREDLKAVFLKGLRTNEFCYNWTRDQALRYQEQGPLLNFGVLMPLSPPGQTRSRDHGIVYAMFKKADLASHNNLQPSDVDLHKLKCAAQSMTIILFNLDMTESETQSPFKLKPPRQGTPTIVGATEVGQIYYSRRTSAYSRHSSF